MCEISHYHEKFLYGEKGVNYFLHAHAYFLHAHGAFLHAHFLHAQAVSSWCLMNSQPTFLFLTNLNLMNYGHIIKSM